MDTDSRDENEECCYICFGIHSKDDPLVRVCRCPTKLHRACIARWQLYSAGKSEEKTCRFCKDSLPDWKPVLTPTNLPAAIPTLSMYYNGTCVRMRVRPGKDGMRSFLWQLESILRRDISTVNLVFRCRSPDTGAEIYLHGLEAFEAAMHCACVRAAQRQLQLQQQLLRKQHQDMELQAQSQAHTAGQAARSRRPAPDPAPEPQPSTTTFVRPPPRSHPSHRTQHGRNLGTTSAPAMSRSGTPWSSSGTLDQLYPEDLIQPGSPPLFGISPPSPTTMPAPHHRSSTSSLAELDVAAAPADPDPMMAPDPVIARRPSSTPGNLNLQLPELAPGVEIASWGRHSSSLLSPAVPAAATAAAGTAAAAGTSGLEKYGTKLSNAIQSFFAKISSASRRRSTTRRGWTF
mmetsp:Transcript_32553/g.71854  ORF Transcript_32553/g.71854 Transcript_32553/m.71854 type:complete len:403 (+) Transcript_32553:258-1466(+)